MERSKEFDETKESRPTVKVKIEFELTLSDCIPETLNKLGLILIQHGQALVIANDSTKSTVEENEECCLPFY